MSAARGTAARSSLLAAVERFPSVRLAHAPTPLDPVPHLGAALGIELWIKRDDCTGLAFGGNKVRQLSVTNVSRLEDRLGLVLLLPRLRASLFGGVGLIGLILAATGILGVMSFAVSQRTHEIGVRVALGARPSRVLAMIMREGVSLAVVGIVVGGALAVGLTRFLSGLLVGVGTSDPITIAVVAVMIVGVTMTACYIPARRALRVDPVVALRQE